MRFIIDILKGIALGAGCILPGISSGVLCVVFGIYDKLVNSIINIFKDFKKNILFLFPIFVGISLGILLFGNILRYLFSSYENVIKSIFAGLILGCIPTLIKNETKQHYFRLHYSIYTITTLLFSILLIYVEYTFNAFSSFNINFLYLFISGFLMSIGVVFPGISSTVILMCLGVYPLYLEAVSLLNFSVLFPMGLGLFLGCIIFLNVINFFMSKFSSQTMYCIIGFVIGSTFILLPNNLSIINILLLALGFIISLFFSNFETQK